MAMDVPKSQPRLGDTSRGDSQGHCRSSFLEPPARSFSPRARPNIGKGPWKLPEPWTPRTRPPLLGKPEDRFSTATTGPLFLSLVTGSLSPMFPVNFVTYVPGCTLGIRSSSTARMSWRCSDSARCISSCLMRSIDCDICAVALRRSWCSLPRRCWRVNGCMSALACPWLSSAWCFSRRLPHRCGRKALRSRLSDDSRAGALYVEPVNTSQPARRWSPGHNAKQ